MRLVPSINCLLFINFTTFTPTAAKLRARSTGHEVPYKDQPRRSDHNTGNSVRYSLRIVCGFFNVPQLFGPRHAKRARTTWHVISSNLHLRSSAKSGGSNWVLIQGAIFTVSIVISGVLPLPSCYLENEAGKKA